MIGIATRRPATVARQASRVMPIVPVAGLALLGLAALAPPANGAETPGSRLPDDVTPKKYEVRLRLDPAASTFQGVVTIDIDMRREASAISLHAVDLGITRASITARGATQAAVARAGASGLVDFTVDRALRVGPARLRIEYEGRLSETPGGLFRVTDKSDKPGAYIHSLFEPAAARRAIPCFDEPARLAIWQIEVDTPADNVVLTNTPQRARARTPDGWDRVTFEPTPPLPPYLLSLAVGPLEPGPVRAAGRNRVPVRVWAARGRVERAAYAQQAAIEIVDKLEAYFSLRYPYRKLDLVAAPIGVAAAESPGLIRFREDLMLVPAGGAEARQRAFVSVCAHEMAHMWFGGLAPIAWWGDVWFKEAFASWIGQKVVEQWQPALTSPLGDALLRVDALLKDTLPSARPLQADVSASTDLRSLYGPLPYEKGPLVVRMIETFVGERAFRDVVRAFLTANTGRPAGLSQFEASLRASKPDGGEAAAMLTSFAVETGVPLVSMKLRCPDSARNAAPRLDLSVTRLTSPDAAPAPGQWRVPFCVTYGDRERSWRQCTVVTRRDEEIVLSEATGCPTWIVPNETAHGYYVTDHDAGLVRALGERIHSAPVSPRVLTTLLSDRQALLPDGAGSLTGAFELVQTLGAHNDPNVVLAAVELTRKAGSFIPADLRGEYQSFVRRQFGSTAESALAQHVGGDVGAAVVRCSSCDTTRLAPVLMAFLADEGGDYPPVVAAARQLADKWLLERASVPADLAPIALRVAGRFGDAATYARLAAAFEGAAAPHRDWLLDALASTEDEARLSATLARPDLNAAQLQRVFQVAARWPASRATAFRHLSEHYDAILGRLPPGADTRLAGWFAASCQIDMKAPIENLFAAKLSADARRRLDRTLTDMARCSAAQQRYETSAREFLREN